MPSTKRPTDRSTEPQGEPCAMRNLEIILVFKASGVPFGVSPQHIREYVAAWLEDREPNLDTDTLDAMACIKAEMISSLPKLPAPDGRPCPRCHDFGYLATEHERPCPECLAGRELAQRANEEAAA